MYCVECQKWEAELARSRPSLPMNVRNLLLSVRDVRQRSKETFGSESCDGTRPRKKEVFEYKLQAIDHHPNNGTYGWWAIDGRYYVQAKTAAEAVMKVADEPRHRNARDRVLWGRDAFPVERESSDLQTLMFVAHRSVMYP